MEPTSSSENARQSRGLARFWPSHGLSAPAQRQPGEDDAVEEAEVVEGDVVAAPAGTAPEPAEEPEPGHPALTGDTQMVALGSRRVPEVLMGTTNGRGWSANQGGFPPIDAERGYRNGDTAPRHGGAPVPNGLPPAAAVPMPPARPPFAAPPGAGGPPPPPPFGPGSPQFAPTGGQPPAPQAPGPQPSPYAPPPFAGRGDEPGRAESDQPVSGAGAGGAHAASDNGASGEVGDRAGSRPDPFPPGRFGQPLGRAEAPGRVARPMPGPAEQSGSAQDPGSAQDSGSAQAGDEPGAAQGASAGGPGCPAGASRPAGQTGPLPTTTCSCRRTGGPATATGTRPPAARRCRFLRPATAPARPRSRAGRTLPVRRRRCRARRSVDRRRFPAVCSAAGRRPAPGRRRAPRPTMPAGPPSAGARRPAVDRSSDRARR